MKTSREWWTGFGDLVTESVALGSERLGRVHLSLADESFNLLAMVPVTRRFSEPVRRIHHGIARSCYDGVVTGARALNRRLPSAQQGQD